MEVKLQQINHHRKDPEGASPSLRKRYAKAIFCMLRRQAGGEHDVSRALEPLWT